MTGVQTCALPICRHAVRIRVLDEIPHEKLRDRPVEEVTREVWQIFAAALGPERVAAA